MSNVVKGLGHDLGLKNVVKTGESSKGNRASNCQRRNLVKKT